MIHEIKNEDGVIVQYTDAEFYAKRDQLILQWQASKNALEVAKQDEIKLRQEVVHFTFDPTKVKGTENVELGNGYKLKAVKKLNFGWIKRDDGKTNKDAIEDALVKIEERSPAGALIAERLVKWTPELSQTEYNLLSAEDKTAIDAVIVTTEGTPSLELVEPKATK